jgi:hypothetical protein
MDFNQTLSALADLEGVPVALDSLITKPAGEFRPEDLRSVRAGSKAGAIPAVE